MVNLSEPQSSGAIFGSFYRGFLKNFSFKNINLKSFGGIWTHYEIIGHIHIDSMYEKYHQTVKNQKWPLKAKIQETKHGEHCSFLN